MTLDEAIAHEKGLAKEIYVEAMLCHANPNDDKLDGCIECGRDHEQLADWLEELKQYRAIGTIEECRVAVDKMKPKKTAIEAIKVHICPVCGSGGIYDYCGNCGQRVQMLSD